MGRGRGGLGPGAGWRLLNPEPSPESGVPTWHLFKHRDRARETHWGCSSIAGCEQMPPLSKESLMVASVAIGSSSHVGATRSLGAPGFRIGLLMGTHFVLFLVSHATEGGIQHFLFKKLRMDNVILEGKASGSPRKDCSPLEGEL